MELKIQWKGGEIPGLMRSAIAGPAGQTVDGKGIIYMSTGKRTDPFLLNERLRVGGEMADMDQDLASRAPETFKEICANSTQTFTECNSRVGLTVALIEGIIASSRVIWMMDLSSMEIQEALKDLKDTYELSMLITLETDAPQGRMHDEEWRKRS